MDLDAVASGLKTACSSDLKHVPLKLCRTLVHQNLWCTLRRWVTLQRAGSSASGCCIVEGRLAITAATYCSLVDMLAYWDLFVAEVLLSSGPHIDEVMTAISMQRPINALGPLMTLASQSDSDVVAQQCLGLVSDMATEVTNMSTRLALMHDLYQSVWRTLGVTICPLTGEWWYSSHHLTMTARSIGKPQQLSDATLSVLESLPNALGSVKTSPHTVALRQHQGTLQDLIARLSLIHELLKTWFPNHTDVFSHELGIIIVVCKNKSWDILDPCPWMSKFTTAKDAHPTGWHSLRQDDLSLGGETASHDEIQHILDRPSVCEPCVFVSNVC